MHKISTLHKISFLVFTFHLLILAFASMTYVNKKSKTVNPIIIKTISQNKHIPTVKKIEKQKAAEKSIKKKAVTKAQNNKIAAKKEISKKEEPLSVPVLKNIDPVKDIKQKKEIFPIQEAILQYLESQILLPEKGNIKIKLEICDSKITSLNILESDSLENNRYLLEFLKGFELPLDTPIVDLMELTITFRGI